MSTTDDTGSTDPDRPSPWDSMDPVIRAGFGLGDHPSASASAGNRTGVLSLKPEVVISAAGGLDAIAAEVAQHQVNVLRDDFDSGHPDLNGALGEFAQRWTHGMKALVITQQDRANGLRKVATDIVGTDVDRAYASEVAHYGLDFV